MIDPILAQTLVARYAQLLKEYRFRTRRPISTGSRPCLALWKLLTRISGRWSFFSTILCRCSTRKTEGGELSSALGIYINEIEKLNRDLLFPVETYRLADSLRTRFIQANTQFHLLLLDSRQAPTV